MFQPAMLVYWNVKNGPSKKSKPTQSFPCLFVLELVPLPMDERPGLQVLSFTWYDFRLNKTGGLGWWFGVGGKAFFLYVFSHFFNSSYHNFKTQKL